MASRNSKYNGGSSATPIQVDVIPSSKKPTTLPEDVSPLLRRNKLNKSSIRKIELVQLVAPYTLAENVEIPILTGLYYDVDNPSMPQPLSAYSRNYRIIGIEAGGNVFYETDTEYERVITDYEYATSIILKALDLMEHPQQVPAPQNTRLLFILMVLQMLTIATLLVIHL